MNKLIIDRKKYFLLSEAEYQALQKQAMLNTQPERLFSLKEAKANSKKLIQKWASGN